MICYIKVNSDVPQSKQFKSIKELSDIGQELNGNGPNVFFNISSINLVANTLGYIQTNNQFGIMPKKQKLFACGFNYFDVDEKSFKNASIYTPYEHFQSSGFTFKDPPNNNTYNVKLNEKMNLIEQTYKWGKLEFDFWVFYRDKNMYFIYEDG